MKYLITGLGNIGSEYLGTRHNIGFRVVNALAEDAGVPFTEERYGAIARMRVKNCELIVLKPNTFMNLSGNAVRYWLQKENIPVENLLVVVDDLALPFGTLRLKGKGNPGIGGAEAGDLLLKVHVGTRPGYERKGMDVYTSTEVPFTTAVLGGEIIVPTLYGNVSCKLREGTRCGLKIRLAGKGIVSMKDPKVKGDQYVTIQIAVPQNLTAEAKEKLREFAAACEKGRRGGRTAA